MRHWQICLIGITVLIVSQVVTAAYPDNLSRITVDNAAEVGLLARVGGDTIFNIEWSHDSQHIAVASRNDVSLYEADDFHASPQILNPNLCSQELDECRSVVHYTPNGALIMVGSGQTLTLYDAATGQQRATYTADQGEVNNMAYDAVHKRLVHINNRAYGGGGGAVFTPTFDPYQIYHEPQPLLPADGGDSPRVGFWEDSTGDFVLSPDGSHMASLDMRYYPSIDSGPGDPFGYQSSDTILLYDLDPIFANLPHEQDGLDYGYQIAETDLAKHRLPLAHDGEVLAMAFSKDGRLLASGTSENTVYLWNVADGSSLILKGHNGPVNDVAFSPDGQTLASVAGDGSIRLWDVATQTTRQIINGLRVSLTAVAFSPDGTRIAVGAWDGSLWIFDAQTGALLDLRVAHWGSIWQMSINSQGTLLAVGNDKNEVVLYEILDKAPYLNEVRTLTGHQGMVYAVEFHPDGVHLASGSSDGTIIVWNTTTGKREQSYDQGTTVFDLAYSPDGACLVAVTKYGYDTVRVEKDEPSCFEGFSNVDYTHQPVTQQRVYSVAFNPQSTALAVADETSLHLISQQGWLVATLSARRNANEDYIPSERSKIIFSHDGQVLLNGAPANGGVIMFMDNKPSIGVPEAILALSPDGTLAAGSDLIIVDTNTGTLLRDVPDRIYSGNPIIRDALFTPDTKLIITADIEGTLNVWGIDAQEDK